MHPDLQFNIECSTNFFEAKSFVTKFTLPN